ncbi:FHA domain-containing protein [archaeon]|nr:MAG: FHA domain-containing protein [archaeon]
MGRALDCAICVSSDKSISRLHAELQVTQSDSGTMLHLVDLGSKFGTFVNDERIAPQTPVEIKDREVKVGIGGSGTVIHVTRKDIRICMTRVDKLEKDMVKVYYVCCVMHCLY